MKKYNLPIALPLNSFKGEVKNRSFTYSCKVFICKIVDKWSALMLIMRIRPSTKRKYKLTSVLSICMLILIGIMSLSDLNGQTIQWQGFTDDDWDDPSNWVQNQVPTSNDDVLIIASPNSPVISGNASAKTIVLGAGAELQIDTLGELLVLPDQASAYGIENNGIISVFGDLIIGSGLIGGGGHGIDNYETFTVEYEGYLEIINQDFAGIRNRPNATFYNVGVTEIGIVVAVGGNSINNDGGFHNSGCEAYLHIGQVILDNNNFTNNLGKIRDESSGDIHINVQDGVVQNLNGGNFTFNSGFADLIFTQKGHIFYGCGGNKIWNSKRHWLPNSIPTVNDSVFIKDEINSPAIGSSQVAYAYSINIDPLNTLTLNSGAQLYIEGSSGDAIVNNGTIINNSGEIFVGLNDVVDGNGIINNNKVENLNGGTINIHQAGLTGFENNGELFNGISSNINIHQAGGIGIHNLGKMTIDTSSTVDINNTGSHGIVADTAILINGNLNIGNIDNISGDGLLIQNNAVVTLADIGYVTINRIGGHGMNNLFSNFEIYGDLSIGTALSSSISNTGILNAGTINSYVNSTIGIESVDAIGIFNNVSSIFNNAGEITMGEQNPIQGDAILNLGSFANLGTGSISIKNSLADGINNFGTLSIFTNEGMIAIGHSLQGAGTDDGIQNGGSFTNQVNGEIQINSQEGDGISQAGGNFINHSIITIGSDGMLTMEDGIDVSDGSFINDSSAIVTINNVLEDGIDNHRIFTNFAKIYLGNSGTIGLDAIDNSFEFTNSGCLATIIVSSNNKISNSLTFENSGHIRENSSDTCSISSNNGFIQNLNGGAFNIGAGNSAITTQGMLWTGCQDSIWNKSANWIIGDLPSDTSDVVIHLASFDPIIKMGTNAFARSIIVDTAMSLSTEAGSTLTIDDFDDFGIQNNGNIENNGSLNIGTNSNFSGITGIENNGTFSNLSQLTIENVQSVGIVINNTFYNEIGADIYIDNLNSTSGLDAAVHILDSLINSGDMYIGAVDGIPSGLRLSGNAVWIHHVGANLHIDNTKRSGIHCGDNSQTHTDGNIEIGRLGPINTFSGSSLSYGGIYVSSIFFKNNGTISIDSVENSFAIGVFDSQFINSAEISIGTYNECSDRAIYMDNNGEFINNVACYIGDVCTDNTNAIISIFNSTMNNYGRIEAGPNIPSDRSLIRLLIAEFNNVSCNSILHGYGDNRLHSQTLGVFTNNGSIIENATGNSLVQTNNGIIQNLNGGIFTVLSGNQPIAKEGLLWSGCQDSIWNEPRNWNLIKIPASVDTVIIIDVDNDPTITDMAAVANSVTVDSAGHLNILAGGQLTIDSFSVFALKNNGQVTNNGALHLGTNSLNNNGIGIDNQGNFENSYTGAIIVQNVANEAVTTSGYFLNDGEIEIGGVGANAILTGINVHSEFENGSSGNIQIDGVHAHGLALLSKNSILSNEGSINIGLNAAIGSVGYASSGIHMVDGTFDNSMSGFVHVDSITQDAAIWIEHSDSLATFNNSGSLRIGELSGVESGINFVSAQTIFNNLATGDIFIDNWDNTLSGIRFEGCGIAGCGTMNNYGTISSGINPASAFIYNEYGVIENMACTAKVVINGNTYLETLIDGVFNNHGLIINNSSASSSLSSNTGLIQNIGGAIFNIVSGDGDMTSHEGNVFWLGHIDSDWNNTENWFPCEVPVDTSDVVILLTSNAAHIATGMDVLLRSIVVDSNTIFSIDSASSLALDGYDDYGIKNIGEFTNFGDITAGQNSSFSNGAALENHGLVYNHGTITTDNDRGFYLLGDTLWNYGNIEIGQDTSRRAFEIRDAVFYNMNGGIVQIDNITLFAVFVRDSSELINYGTIEMGQNGPLGTAGLLLTSGGKFLNQSNGILTIDDVTNNGMLNSSAIELGPGTSFDNYGQCSIGNNSNIAGQGFRSQGEIKNYEGATIDINRVQELVLIDVSGIFLLGDGQFSNYSTITFGPDITPGLMGVFADNTSNFTNMNCSSLLHLLGNNHIVGNIDNAGSIIENSSDTSSILTNTGTIQNLNGGEFEVASGAPAISFEGSIWNGCQSVIWNEPSNWLFNTLPTDSSDVYILDKLLEPWILAGDTVQVKSVYIDENSSLLVLPESKLKVTNADTNAIENHGLVNNLGEIEIWGAGANGISNFGTFSNNSGLITIDSIDENGILDSGDFINENNGNIYIGTNEAIGQDGIIVNGNFPGFINDNSLVTVQNTLGNGVQCTEFGKFTNQSFANIIISDVQLAGIKNSGEFLGLSESLMNIDNTGGHAIHSEFVWESDSCTINIGQSPSGFIGGSGIFAQGSFETLISTFNIDKTMGPALEFETSNLKLELLSHFHIGQNGPISNPKAVLINADAGSTAELTTCSSIHIYSDNTFWDENENFTNNLGIIIENATGDSKIDANEGWIQNLNGGNFDIGIDNGIEIIEEGLVWVGCSDTTWSTPGNWHTYTTPTMDNDVIIPDFTLANPVLTLGDNFFIKSLLNYPGASLILKSGSRLNVVDP